MIDQMNLELVLQEWKVIRDKDTKVPRLCGTFALMSGDKEIARQTFNEGYGAKEVAMSGEAIAAAMSVEVIIKSELEKVLK